MIECERRGIRLKVGEGSQRYLLPGTGFHIQAAERIRILPKFRGDLEHYVILIQLREDRGHQPLPEGVVERVVDARHR